ncbi:MAG: endonuclease/exonuclease/phosphatase family protein [Bacteroidales bacterium]|nr:endonuclease/exonuclease/phosphatase family protein [Bacteroidales bacterium]
MSRINLKSLKYILTALLLSLSLVSASTKEAKESKELNINVLLYNIHHCNPPAQRGVIDLDSIVSVIKLSGADIAFLQEVDHNVSRSGGIDQTSLLAQKSGLKYHYFYKAIDFMGGDYGVAILSRFPLSDFNTIKLDSPVKSEDRVLGTAIVHIGDGKRLLIASTHLDLNKINRERQIAQIDSVMKLSPYPLILAGDFNATPESDEIKYMVDNYISSTTDFKPTFPNISPNRTIDYIFIRNHPVKSLYLEFTSHKVLQNIDASDHLPVVASIKITEKR